MAKEIKLVTVDSGTGNAVVQYDGNGKDVTVQGAYNGTDTVIIPGWGTFKALSDGKTTFTGEAGLSGELKIGIAKDASIVANTESTLRNVDFRASSSGVKFTNDIENNNIYGGMGNDTITVSKKTNVNAGAGNDLVHIQGGNLHGVNLGAGADTLKITEGNVTLNDYNYYEGDVIEASSSMQAKFTSGDFLVTESTGAGSSYSLKAEKVAVQDNWYAARVNRRGANDTIDFFSAVAGSNATRDFSKFSKSTVRTSINATEAKSANITLGSGESGVLFSSGVDTVKVGKSSQTSFSQFGKDDIIAIDGVKLSNLTCTYNDANSSSYTILNYAATAITLHQYQKDNIININDGSKTHKLAYAMSQKKTFAYTDYSNADWFYGNADGNTTLEVGATTHLHDNSKYKDITKISVADSANLDAPISLTGAIGKDNSIDATHAKVGVATWGFSSGNDSITLGAGQDTVWFGAGDGTDAISGFQYGTAKDSDILYLKDTQSLKEIQPVFNTSDGTADLTVGKALAKVATNQGSNDVAQIKLADEKTYKVAGNYNSQKTVYINTDETDGLDYYAFDKSKAQTVNIKGSKDWIVHSLYTDFYTTGATIEAIDASKATGNVTLAAAADIKGGEGTSNIWTYQANTSASVTAGKGTDIIWFAENADKDVAVSSFDTAKDIVKFATAQSLKEIADNYSFATVVNNTSTDTAITGVNNTDSVLTLNGVKDATINLVDGNDKAYKALVMKTEAAGTTGEFSTDVNIYAGMTTLTAGGAIDGTVSLRLGKESRGLSSDTYYIDDAVTKFDGSKSTATFWIAGNANKGNEIIGGLTENYLYGGGASSDTLGGSVLAKDTFYFGTGDGVDTISAGVDTKDTIALWNIADADIANVKVTMDTDGTANIHLADSSTLKLTDTNAASALKKGLTFTSASQTAYTYDAATKSLVKKP